LTGDVQRENDLDQRILIVGPPAYSVRSLARAPWSSIEGATGTRVLRAGSGFVNNQLIDIPGGAPFAFPFFNAMILAGTSAKLSDNGFLSFSPLSTSSFPENLALPAQFGPNHAISVFWDDLVRDRINPSALLDRVDGLAPNRIWTIEYRSLGLSNNSGRFSSKILIYESSGLIRFLYNLESSFVSPSSATIGLVDSFGFDSIDATGLEARNPALPTSDLEFYPSEFTPIVDLAVDSLQTPARSTQETHSPPR
jgi:hypothetical protein